MLTPSQTVGPFFHPALLAPRRDRLVAAGHPGALRLHGVVVDGASDPVPDAMVEVWDAPARRFGRVGTDARGGYAFVVTKPDPVVEGERTHAPHLELAVFARGLLRQAVTRVYFPDEGPANAEDPLLSWLADPALAGRLVASHEGDGLRFDIRLQGEASTPFFDLASGAERAPRRSGPS